MVTLKEIAKICGVTASTVSNVLNGKAKVGPETRKRILEVVEQTGYQPNFFAQGIRKLKTKTLGIIVEDLLQFGTAPIVEAIMAYCEDHNYRTVLMNMRLYDKWQDSWYDDGEKLHSVLDPFMTQLLSIKVDGILYVAGHCRSIDCFPKNFSIPGIVVYGLSKESRFPSVVINDEKIAYESTKHFLTMGHRKIGVLSGRIDNIHAQNRLIGYQKALYEADITYNPSTVRYGDWGRASGYREAEHLLNMDITGVFCMNDDMSVGFYEYAYDHGIVIGKDISVIGCDNWSDAVCIRPKLTTTDLKLRNIGLKAAEIMVDKLEISEDEKDNISNDAAIIRLDGELIKRDSVRDLTAEQG